KLFRRPSVTRSSRNTLQELQNWTTAELSSRLFSFVSENRRLASVHLPVEDIALTSAAQIRKLELVLAELDKSLGLQDSSQIKWNIKHIVSQDVAATLKVLYALFKKHKEK
ncbi:hypothetical protein F2P81_006514, partial [Scophthalmus maximus]